MGVTYKLKQEVVDLIVQKKKEEPSLSCRKLEILLQESFHLDVSKSSINAVIKEFNLSNPVGRKAINPSKNFNIPQEKKQQLLAQVTPFLPPAIILDGVVETAVQVDAAQADVADVADVGEESLVEKEDDILPEDDLVPVPLKLRKDPLAVVDAQTSGVEGNFVERKESLQVFVWDGDKGALWEKAGLFFLWAFVQDLFRRRLVGEVLARSAGFDMNKAKALEATVYLPFFNVSRLEDLRAAPLDCLWNMLEVDPKQGVMTLEDFLGKNINPASIGVLLEVELAAALFMAQYFNCLTHDGRKLCLSGDLTGILIGAEGGRGVPVFTAIQRAVDGFILHKPMLVNMLGKDVILYKDEILLWAGQGGAIDKIELIAENNQKVWEFVLKPNDLNNIMVVCENKPEYADKIKIDMIDNPLEYYDGYMDQKYFLVEGAWTGFPDDKKWRAILIEKDGFSEKRIILTNIDSQYKNTIEIIRNYLENINSVSLLTKSHNFMGNDSINQIKFTNSCSMIENLSKISTKLNELMLEHVSIDFSSTSDVRSIFNLSGYVQQRKEDVITRLVVPPDFPEIKLLGEMVSKIGSASFVDQDGRKYYFSIEK